MKRSDFIGLQNNQSLMLFEQGDIETLCNCIQIAINSLDTAHIVSGDVDDRRENQTRLQALKTRIENRENEIM